MNLLTNPFLLSGLLGGCVIGLVIGSLWYYLGPYRRICNMRDMLSEQLQQLQQEYDDLQGRFNKEQIQRQQEARLRQKAEADLQQLQTASAAFDKQHHEQLDLWNGERQIRLQEAKKLKAQIQQLTDEKRDLESRLNQEILRAKQDRYNMELDNQQLESQLERLKREKAALEARFEEQREMWERQHLELDMRLAQIQTERDQLQTHLLANPGNVSKAPDTASFAMQSQIAQLKADKKALEEKLAAQSAQAEQARQALEEEISQLLNRLMSIQSQDESHNKMN